MDRRNFLKSVVAIPVVTTIGIKAGQAAKPVLPEPVALPIGNLSIKLEVSKSASDTPYLIDGPRILSKKTGWKSKDPVVDLDLEKYMFQEVPRS